MRLLYLHGFRSTPESSKAQDIARYCQIHGLSAPIIPQLPISPKACVKLCEQLIKEHKIDTICGSSLGGFYAVYLAEKYHLCCAVINPAITPWKELRDEHLQARYNLGEIEHDEAIHYVAELHRYHVKQLSDLKRYLLLVALGDEVLSPTQMRAYFTGAHEIVVNGGSHTLDDFGGYLDAMMMFLTRGI